MTQERTEKPGIDVETYMRWGKEAAERGNKRRAYRYFSQVVKVEEGNEEAWLWKGAMAEDPEESLACMRKVLALNPKSRRAWQGFEWAAARLARAKGEAVELPSIPLAEEEMPEEASPPAEEITPEPSASEPEDLEEPEDFLPAWRTRLSRQWAPIVGLSAVVAISLLFFLILKFLGG